MDVLTYLMAAPEAHVVVYLGGFVAGVLVGSALERAMS